MSVPNFCRFALVCAICCLTPCGGRYPEPKIKRVPVVSVRGSVNIDGNPEEGVIVRCLPQGTFEPSNLANSLGGRTDQQGEFTLGTYEIADGVPPADYVLTFLWPPATLKKQSREEEEKHDRLKGRYLKVEQSPLKFQVANGMPLTLEGIDLKTK